MKRPNISFDKEAILKFFLSHGEKFVVAIVAASACGLLWGGVRAIQNETPRKEQSPKAIFEKATKADANISKEKNVPKEQIAQKGVLAKAIAVWIEQSPKKDCPECTVLNQPLFEELSKRTKPNVFPIENLSAVAGTATLALKPKPNGGQVPGKNEAQRDIEPDPRGPGNRLPRGKPKAERPVFGGEPMAEPEETIRSKIVPYVVVTGLIPVAKQAGEYQTRFASASHRDPKRDAPLWSGYLVERSIVSPNARETWEKIDLKAVAKDFRDTWEGPLIESLPSQFLLAGDQTPGLAPTGYCAPLPKNAATESWGTEGMHPWFVEKIRAEIVNRKKAAATKDTEETEAPMPAAVAPNFDPVTAESDPNGVVGRVDGEPKGPLDAAGRPVIPLEYRLFRFVDTNVEVGKSYRYRVALELWNPNFKLPEQYLENVAMATEPKLPSNVSEPTPAVTLLGTTALLAQKLRKAESKRLKPGMLEVLVIAENKTSSGFFLSSLITEIGGLANFDKTLNKPGEARVRASADVITDRVLVDVRGRQEDRQEDRVEVRAPKKPLSPPEPFEMLYLRNDGTFERVSSAESQVRIKGSIGTLPPLLEDGRAVDRPNQPGVLPMNNPFGTPREQK